MRNTSPATTGTSHRYCPFSRTSAYPETSLNANGISAELVPALLLLKPAKRTRFVSETVNSKYPSPELICCRETAPASSQPSQPLVFLSELPVAVTLTRLVQVTFC